MNKYIGITIGPIVDTLMMARKPRELFSASFLFSYLTKCILLKLEKRGKLLSPAYDGKNDKCGIGLYPDRIFCKFAEKEIFECEEILQSALSDFKNTLFNNEEKTDIFIRNYLKISFLVVECEKDAIAVRVLNRLLDGTELSASIVRNETENPVLSLIRKKNDSRLFEEALGNKNLEINTLGEIAAASLDEDNENQKEIRGFNWKSCRDLIKKWEYDTEKKETLRKKIEEILQDKALEDTDDTDDIFYALLKKRYGQNFKPYHKYICVVQADGDNMGKIVNELEDGQFEDFSNDLIKFDIEAKDCIEGYGGLPIYAGGDDLLFIAPVVGKRGKHIFDLLNGIDLKFRDKMYGEDGKCKYSEKYFPSISYGISITYYKYPLYEAFGQARELLFMTAKKVKGKNAVAWTLQKNSGSSVNCTFCKDSELKMCFEDLLESVDTNLDWNYVSSTAHKIKANQNILELIVQTKDFEKRLDSFFKTFLDVGEKKGQADRYLEHVRKLMEVLIGQYRELPLSVLTDSIIPIEGINKGGSEDSVWAEITKQITEDMYCMLRTVKFIKGLEENHE